MGEKKDFWSKYNQLQRIADSLENGEFNNLSENDILIAAEILAERSVDLTEVEEIVKRQVILELAGVEEVFGGTK